MYGGCGFGEDTPTSSAVSARRSATDRSRRGTLEDTPDRILVLDTKVPRRWESVVNNAIDSVAQRRPNVEVVDWNSYTSARPELFTRAQAHVTPKDQVTCAGLFDRIINRSCEGVIPVFALTWDGSWAILAL